MDKIDFISQSPTVRLTVRMISQESVEPLKTTPMSIFQALMSADVGL